jgi:hypothetical protein
MSRNFGLPQTLNRNDRGSLWPLMLIAFFVIGIVDVALHLHQ